MANKHRSAQQEKRDVSAENRAIEAMRLRTVGYTYREIAARIGYAGQSSAYQAVQRIREKTRRDTAQAYADVQSDRIERAIVVCMTWIEEQPLKEKLWALDRLVPLFKRQAELLGLDAEPSASSAAPERKVLLRGSQLAAAAVAATPAPVAPELTQAPTQEASAAE